MWQNILLELNLVDDVKNKVFGALSTSFDKLVFNINTHYSRDNKWNFKVNKKDSKISGKYINKNQVIKSYRNLNYIEICKNQ